MSRQYRVIGIDRARDAAEVEKVARRVPGVDPVRASAASQVI